MRAWVLLAFLPALTFGQFAPGKVLGRIDDGGISGDVVYVDGFSIPVPNDNLLGYWCEDYGIESDSTIILVNTSNEPVDTIDLIGLDWDITKGYIPLKTAATMRWVGACTIDTSFWGNVVKRDVYPCTVFSDLEYEDQIFFKKETYTLNANKTESLPNRITEIAIYDVNKTGVDSVLLYTYFNVPKYPTTPRTVGVEQTYATITLAIAGANAGDTVVVKSGAYTESCAIDKGLTILSVGNTAHNGNTSYCYDISPAAAVKIIGEVQTTTLNYVYRIRGAGSHSINNCHVTASTNWCIESSNLDYTYTWNDCYLYGGSYLQDNNIFNDCYIKASAAGNSIATGWDRDVSLNRCLIINNANSNAFRGYSYFNLNSNANIYHTATISTTTYSDDDKYDAEYNHDKFYKNNTTVVLGMNTHGDTVIIDSCYFWQLNTSVTDLFSTTDIGYLSLTNSEFNDFSGYIVTTETTTPYDVLIDNNRFISSTDNAAGIVCTNVDLIFTDNYLYGDTGIYISYNAAMEVTRPVISRNEIHSKSGSVNSIRIGTITEPSTYFCDSALISENLMYGPKYYGDNTSGTHGIFINEKKNVVVTKNRLIGFPLGIVFRGATASMKGTTASYNLLEECKSGIVVRGVSGTNVFNNTFYTDTILSGTNLVLSTDDTARYSYADTTTVKNNLMYNKLGYNISSDSTANLTNSDFDYNVYYNSENVAINQMLDYDFTTWKSTFTQDANSSEENPNYTSATQLWPVTPFTGFNLGLPYDDGLDITTVWPLGIVTKQQGATWQIGSYVK